MRNHNNIKNRNTLVNQSQNQPCNTSNIITMVSLDRLLQWFAQQGVVWDDMHLSITTSAGTTGPALGIYATADIAPGHRLCLIPKAAVLSRRNVAIADALEDAQIGGGLSLNIAVMHELAHGTNSPWWVFFWCSLGGRCCRCSACISWCAVCCGYPTCKCVHHITYPLSIFFIIQQIGMAIFSHCRIVSTCLYFGQMRN